MLTIRVTLNYRIKGGANNRRGYYIKLHKNLLHTINKHFEKNNTPHVAIIRQFGLCHV